MKMFTSVFFTFWIVFCYAQPISYIGLKVGPYFANAKGEHLGLPIFKRTTTQFGLVGEFVVEQDNVWLKRLVFSNELCYASKGMKEYIAGKELEFALGYISYSNIAKYYFGFMGGYQAGFYAKVGAYGAYMVSASRSYNDTIVKVKDGYRPLDVGLIAGGGFSLWLLSLDVSYDYGMAKILQSKGDLYNKAWGINLILTIPMSRLTTPKITEQ